MTGFARQFLAHEDRYFRDRVTDIYDLKRRILRHLTQRGVQDLASVTEQSIVIARDLTPSQTAGLDPDLIKGLATDLGGHTPVTPRSSLTRWASRRWWAWKTSPSACATATR